MLSETIVLLWLLPVVLNIILPLAVLGIRLGVKLLTLVRRKAMTGEESTEMETVQSRLFSASNG